MKSANLHTPCCEHSYSCDIGKISNKVIALISVLWFILADMTKAVKLESEESWVRENF